MDHIVVDVEIARTIEQVGGWGNTDKMGVAVACVWEYTGARMRVYGPGDVLALRERLLKADRISGYNTWSFDFPLIWATSKNDWQEAQTSGSHLADLKNLLDGKSNDLLRRIWQAEGFNPDKWQAGMAGSKLDDIAGATLGVHKIGNGADAPKWFQAGQVQRVVNYCADDVAIERDLTDFVDRYGFVIKGGRQLKIPH